MKSLRNQMSSIMANELDTIVLDSISQPLQDKIIVLSNIALQTIRNNPDDPQTLTQQLMYNFHKELIPAPNSKISTQGEVKRNSFGGDCEFFNATLTPSASLKESMEQIQWKNNQKQTIASTLQQIIIMLIRNHRPLFKTIERPFEEKTNIATTTHVHTCQTESSTPGRDDPLSRTEGGLVNFKFSKALKENMGGQGDYTISSSQKKGLDKVLEILKAERMKNSKYKEVKLRCFRECWQNYGTLLNVQKEKFQENFIFDKLEQIQDRLMKDLNKKNVANMKMIKQFKKKIDLTSSQEKMKKQLNEDSGNATEKYNFGEMGIKSQQLQSPSWGLSLTNNINLKKTSKKIYTIRSKPKLVPSSLSNTMDLSHGELKEEEIKAKVQSSFKESKKYGSLGKNILNNIVFDSQSMLMSSKKKWFGKVIQRNCNRKLERPIKNNRLLLRVGGIRLSLQEYNFKKIVSENQS